jgi:hypothetical protein
VNLRETIWVWRLAMLWGKLLLHLDRKDRFVFGQDLLNFSLNLGCGIFGDRLINPRLQQGINFVPIIYFV